MKRSLLFLAFFLVWSSSVRAAPMMGLSPCWKSIFEANEKRGNQKYRLLILPFENASHLEQDSWISFLFPVVLQDYLALSKETRSYMAVAVPRPAFFDSSQALAIAKKASADYLMIGQFSRVGGLLQTSVRLIDVKKEIEVSRHGGPVEFPGTRTINDFLLVLAEQASKSFPHVKLKRKVMLPYRNETASDGALRSFVLGTVALKQGTARGVKEAIGRFEESIRNDYNYVPAYLGLSLALARQGSIENAQGLNYRDSFSRARRELEKGRLLRPEITRLKGREIEPYLVAETHYQLANNYAADQKNGKTIQELRKAVRTLPGDIGSMKQLVSYLMKEGEVTEAKEHEARLKELTSCEEES